MQCVYEIPFSANCFERTAGADLNCDEYEWFTGERSGFVFSDHYCFVDATTFPALVTIVVPTLAFSLPFFVLLLALSSSYRVGAINAVLAITVLEALYFAPHVGGPLELWADQTVESRSPTLGFFEPNQLESTSTSQ